MHRFWSCSSEYNHLGQQILRNETGIECFKKHDLTWQGRKQMAHRDDGGNSETHFSLKASTWRATIGLHVRGKWSVLLKLDFKIKGFPKVEDYLWFRKQKCRQSTPYTRTRFSERVMGVAKRCETSLNVCRQLLPTTILRRLNRQLKPRLIPFKILPHMEGSSLRQNHKKIGSRGD